MMIPFILLTAFANIALQFPLQAYQTALKQPDAALLVQSLRMLGSGSQYFSLLLALALGWSFARVWQTASLQKFFLAVLSAFCFLILVGTGTEHFHMAYLAGSGVFSSLLAAVCTCHLYLFVLAKMKHFRFILRANIDYNLQEVVYALLPLTVVLLTCVFLQNLVLFLSGGVLLQDFFAALSMRFILWLDFSPLLSTSVYVVLSQLLWFIGVQGQHFLYAIDVEYYGAFAAANEAAALHGAAPLYIINHTANNIYLFLGGTGSVFALLLAIFCFSRNPATRMLAKIACVPTLFNISEILVFGLPIIMNPLFLVPFFLAPLLNLFVYVLCTWLQFVPVVTQHVFWATPPLLSGYLATGSWRGTVLQLFLLGMNFCLYVPFVKLYDRRQDHSMQTALRRLKQTYLRLEQMKKPLRLRDLPADQRVAANMLLRALRQDICTEKIFLVYQPQFSADGKFVGAESLLRWNYDEDNAIYPPLTIALAKAGGMLHRLEQRIFHDACQTVAILEKLPLDGFEISVNITGTSLQDPRLETSLAACVKEAGILPEHLWVEVTEQDALESSRKVIARLQNLKRKGHRLLIDDFGMGNTSIIYLRSNLFDVIKLDGSITQNILTSRSNQQIVSSLTSLSRQMHLRVVAEFVESAAQRDRLAEIGCDAFQGYLYSKPLNVFEFVDLLDKGILLEMRAEDCYILD